MIMIRRSSTRSLTRSPTPIKYDYDIYKKRSPTFGSRCPVLNRRPRNSSKNEINNRSKSNPSTSSSSSATTTTPRKEEQQLESISSSQSTANSLDNKNNNNNLNSNINKDNNKQRNNHDTGKSVSSRISSSIAASGSSSKNATRPIGCWVNPSYFQHDDRQSQSIGGSKGGVKGGVDEKISRKRKPRQSPFRWQHDLYEDDKSPLEKVEPRSSQRKKEAKMSKNVYND